MKQTRVVRTQEQAIAFVPLVLLYAAFGCFLTWGSLLVCLPLTAHAAEKAEIEYDKGIVEYSNRNYLDALDHFRKAAELTPDNPDVQFYLGLSLRRIGEVADAIIALEKALQLDPSKQYIHHHLGLAYFLEKRYDDALGQFQLAEQFDPKKVETHYYLGYTHYLLKQYQQVLEPMQRVIDLDPSLASSAQYYRGLALYALEQDAQAQEAFDAVIEADPESTAAQNAQSYLEAVQRRVRERRLYQIQGSVGFQQDDNVILEPNDIQISGEGESDSRMVFSLLGRLIPVRTPQWRAGAEYSLFQSVHFRLSEFDIQSHTAGLFARLKMNRVTLRMAASGNVTFLDSRVFSNYDLFSDSVTVQPSATIQQTRALFAVVSVRFRYSNFFDDIPSGQDPEVRDRDGWSVRFGADQYLSFNKRRSLARLSYRYRGSRNDGTDWEYDSHHVGLGLQTLLWKDFTLNVDWGYTRYDYLHVNSFSFDGAGLGILDLDTTSATTDTEERQDDRFTASITLTQALGRFFFLSLNFAHTTNLSNIAFFDYRRNIVALTLTGRY
jgi:tetratricopeptide (TPR) repeat protein